MMTIIERLRDVEEHDWRVSHLAHTSDTAKCAREEIGRLTSEHAAMRAVIAAIREVDGVYPIPFAIMQAYKDYKTLTAPEGCPTDA